MCETWGNDTSDFDNTLPDYSHFSYVREKPRTARRNSGGVSVFVKQSLVENGYIKQVFDNMNDCVVLLFDGICLNVKKNIIMIFTYVSPENSNIYTDQQNRNDKVKR